MTTGHRYSIFRVVDNDLLALGHGSTPQTGIKPLPTALILERPKTPEPTINILKIKVSWPTMAALVGFDAFFKIKLRQT